MNIDFSFEALCAARQREKGQKYEYFQCSKCGEHFSVIFAQKDIEGKEHKILSSQYIFCDGILERHNQAEKRNCAFDVAEELADAVNICELWLKKTKSSGKGLSISALQNLCRIFGEFALDLARDGKDEIEVERVVEFIK